MRSLLGILAAIGVMLLAFWAYQENYRTQAALRELAELKAEISRRESSITMLRAEWAYLNRPDRLRDLAEINFDRLGLVPVTAEELDVVESIPYPMRPPLADAMVLPLVDVVPTRGPLEQEP